MIFYTNNYFAAYNYVKGKNNNQHKERYMQRSPTNLIKTSFPNSYFAAANSGSGFISFFHDIFFDTQIKKRYIIKGGPGTGKSTLMKKAALTAQTNSLDVECILCSSDPYSFDGVMINTKKGKIAIIDGTAPHATEAAYPGVYDELLDLGICFDTTQLEKNSEKIKELCAKKAHAYKTAYTLLSCALKYEKYRQQLLTDCIDKEKLHKAVMRVLNSYISKSAPKANSSKFKIKSAISSKGYCQTDIYEYENGAHIDVIGSHGACFAVIDMFRKCSLDKGFVPTLSPTPLCPDTYDAMSIPACGFYVCEKSSNEPYNENVSMRINSERFLNQKHLKEVKAELRLLSRLKNDAVRSAYKFMSIASSNHSLLEEIYTPSVNFRYVEDIGEKLFDKIFS